jgi:hypothetical protein
MLPAHLPLLLLLLLAIPGAAEEPAPTTWTGIDAASVVVVGNGVVTYDGTLIKERIERELAKAGLTCTDPHPPTPGMPRATIVAHVDGMRLRRDDGTPTGCIYYWSLSASCWADRVAGGSGMVILEEHHDIGYGPTTTLPNDCVNDFSLLASRLAVSWLRDNPQ